MTTVRQRDLILSLKYSTIEACFSVPMLNLTMPNFPFVIGFVVSVLEWKSWLIGLMAALPHICNFLQPPLSRWLEKRVALFNIMRLGFALSGAPWLLIVFFEGSRVTENLLFAGVLFITSLANSVTSVAWSAGIAELVPPRVSGRFFGTRNMIFGVWTLIAVMVAGVIVGRASEPARAFAWIFFAAGCGRLLGLLYLNKMKFPEAVTQQQDVAKPWSDMLAPLENRNYLYYIGFVALFGFFLNLGMPFYPVFLMRELSFNLGEVVFLTTIGAVGGLVTLRAWGWLVDHYGNKPVQYVTAGVWALVGTAGWLLAGPEWNAHLYAAFFIIGGTTAGFQLCQFNLMLKLIPAKRSAHVSVFLAATSLATALGPIVGGALLQVFPLEVGSLFDQPVTRFHLLFVLSFLGCALSLPILRKVEETAASEVQNVWEQMWKMRAFNPLLAVGTAAELFLTPRGIMALGRTSFRTLKKQLRNIGEVGTDLVNEGQELFKSR